MAWSTDICSSGCDNTGAQRTDTSPTIRSTSARPSSASTARARPIRRRPPTRSPLTSARTIRCARPCGRCANASATGSRVGAPPGRVLRRRRGAESAIRGGDGPGHPPPDRRAAGVRGPAVRVRQHDAGTPAHRAARRTHRRVLLGGGVVGVSGIEGAYRAPAAGAARRHTAGAAAHRRRVRRPGPFTVHRRADRAHLRAPPGHSPLPGMLCAGQSFLHVDDLAEAVARVVDRRQQLPDEMALVVGEARVWWRWRPISRSSSPPRSPASAMRGSGSIAGPRPARRVRPERFRRCAGANASCSGPWQSSRPH